MREEFGRNIRLPPHGHSVKGGGRWAKPRLPQPHPPHARWPPAAQWSQDDNKYDKRGYGVGEHRQNQQDEVFNAPHCRMTDYSTILGVVNHKEVGHLFQNQTCPWWNILMTTNTQWTMFTLIGTAIKSNIHNGKVCTKRTSIMILSARPFGMQTTNLLSTMILPCCLHLQASINHTIQPQWVRCKHRPTVRNGNPSTSKVVEDVYSFESFNPESSTTKSIPNAEDIVQPTVSPKKKRCSVQLIYEKVEADRILRGQNPFRIECNSAGRPIEFGRVGFRSLQVLKALCIIFLDVSIIKIWDQNMYNYTRLREEVESKFEVIGHLPSDKGFKKTVFKCMKAERSRLHKLYTSQPECECPTKEQPDVWDMLKTYWIFLEFGKVMMWSQQQLKPQPHPKTCR